MFKKLVTLTDKFLDVALELCACIPIDINMRKAIRQRTCVVDAFPQAPAARAFKSLARRVLNWPIPDIAGGYLEFFVENLIRRPDENGNLPELPQTPGFGEVPERNNLTPPAPIGSLLGLGTSGSAEESEIMDQFAHVKADAIAAGLIAPDEDDYK